MGCWELCSLIKEHSLLPSAGKLFSRGSDPLSVAGAESCDPGFRSPGSSVVKNPPAEAGDPSLIPGSGRPPAGGNGNHSSILAWEIPWTEKPGGLQSVGPQESDVT